MSHTKRKKSQQSPEETFRLKLWEECRKTPGMTVKVERIPQGSMENYVVEYISACNVDAQHIDSYIQERLGDGNYLIIFVDENCCPLEEFGSLWIRLAFENRDEFEAETEKAWAELLGASIELKGLQNKAVFDCAADLMRNCNPPGMSYGTVNALMAALLAKADGNKDTIERIGQLVAIMSAQQGQLAKQKAERTKQVVSDMICNIFQTLQESGQLPEQQEIQPGTACPQTSIQQLSEQGPQASKSQNHTQLDPQMLFAPRKFRLFQTSTTTAKDEDGEIAGNTGDVIRN